MQQEFSLFKNPKNPDKVVDGLSIAPLYEAEISLVSKGSACKVAIFHLNHSLVSLFLNTNSLRSLPSLAFIRSTDLQLLIFQFKFPGKTSFTA